MLDKTKAKKKTNKTKHVEEAASAPRPVAEYQPLDLPPETAKEWATSKFNLPTQFLGEMLFHTQTIAMFTMKTDAGKTNWTIACGLALAYGRPFMEWAPVKRARVLYIEGETPKYRTQSTIRTQLKALGIPEEEWATANFTLVTRQSHPDMPLSLNVPRKSAARSDNAVREQQEQAGKTWLFDLIKKHRPNFVVFDSIQSLCPKMVSTSATKWIEEIMQPIVVPINRMNISQLWLHHPDKSGKAQHGVGARNWGLSLELFGLPLKNRGICFNLLFPGKKKDDLGNNPDFDDRTVQFNRDGTGVSRWVVGPVTPTESTTLEAHRPNQSAPLAMTVFRELVEDKPDVWIPSDLGSEWCKACIAAGISTATNRAHQAKAYTRARNHLIEQRLVERRPEDGHCRLFPPMPPDPELEADTVVAGSA